MQSQLSSWMRAAAASAGVALAVAMAPGAANATAINGSASLSGLGTILAYTTTAETTQTFDLTQAAVIVIPTLEIGSATGTFTTPTDFTGSTISNFTLNLSSPLTNTATFTSGGSTLDINGLTFYDVISRTTNNLDIYLLGNVDETGYTSGSGDIRLSFNVSGVPGNFSIGGGGSLASPPTPIQTPEPASLAVLAVGLLGLGMVRAKRA